MSLKPPPPPLPLPITVAPPQPKVATPQTTAAPPAKEPDVLFGIAKSGGKYEIVGYATVGPRAGERVLLSIEDERGAALDELFKAVQRFWYLPDELVVAGIKG